MSRRFQFSLRALGIYVTTLCAIAALFGAIISSIEQGARTPLRVALRYTGIGVLERPGRQLLDRWP